MTSAPVASAAPATATAMPSQVAPAIGTRRARAISAAHTGWVQTRAVEVAAVVNFTLGTQVPKWTASATPARPHSAAVDRFMARTSGTRTVAVTGANTPTAKALRQNAMASAGAAAYVMRGADDDTAASAIINAATTAGPGSARNPMLPCTDGCPIG